MVSQFGAVAKAMLRTAGYYRRRLARETFTGPAVLCYHNVLADDVDRTEIPFSPLHVSASRLDEQCRAIAETCHPLSLESFLNGWEGRDRWPARPVLFTFDDGYRNVATVAGPILAKYEIPAVVFACTGTEEMGGAFWVDRVAAASGEDEVERLKERPDEERRDAAARTPAYPFPHEHCRLMTKEDLKELATKPGWEVGGHSHTHPILAQCNLERQREEIELNAATIEAATGKKSTSFAYPNGRPNRDYDETTKGLVADAGIKVAFTTASGFAVDQTRPYDVPRFLMLESVVGTELLHRLAFSWRT